MDTYHFSLWQLFYKGGPMMWPLLLCSVLVVAIVLDKIFYFRRSKIRQENFMEDISDKVRRQQISEALRQCDLSDTPISRVLKAGLLKHDRPRIQIKEAMEEAFTWEQPVLKHNVHILYTIAAIAPLLGILGSVLGFIKSFQLQISGSPQGVFSGAWESLLTVVYGLAVSILATISYNYLLFRVENLNMEIEKHSAGLLDQLE